MSPRMTASATSFVAAPALMAVSANSAAQLPMARRRFMVIALSASPRRLQIFKSSGAVPDAVHVNIESVQNAEQKVPRRLRLFQIQFWVRKMTIAFQLSVRAPDEDMRDVIVPMLIGVPHVRSVEHQRVIEQRAVAV